MCSHVVARQARDDRLRLQQLQLRPKSIVLAKKAQQHDALKKSWPRLKESKSHSRRQARMTFQLLLIGKTDW